MMASKASAQKRVRRKQIGFFNINNRVHPVYYGLNVVGRAIESTIFLQDARYSKLHAIISVLDDHQFYITDFKSTNGTWLGNQQLTPYLFYKLENGAKIKLTDTVGIFTLDRPKDVSGEDCALDSPQPATAATDIHIASTQRMDDFHEAETQASATHSQKQAGAPPKIIDPGIEAEFLHDITNTYDDIFASETFRMSLAQDGSTYGVVVDETVLGDGDKNLERQAAGKSKTPNAAEEDSDTDVDEAVLATIDKQTAAKLVGDGGQRVRDASDSETDVDEDLVKNIHQDKEKDDTEEELDLLSSAQNGKEPSKGQEQVARNTAANDQEELDLLTMPKTILSEQDSQGNAVEEEVDLLAGSANPEAEAQPEKSQENTENIDFEETQLSNTSIAKLSLSSENTQPLSSGDLTKLNELLSAKEAEILASKEQADGAQTTKENLGVIVIDDDDDDIIPQSQDYKRIIIRNVSQINRDVEVKEEVEDDDYLGPTQKMDLPLNNNVEDVDLLAPTQLLSKTSASAASDEEINQSADRVEGDTNADIYLAATQKLSTNTAHVDSRKSKTQVEEQEISRTVSNQINADDDIYFCATQKLNEPPAKDVDGDDIPPTQLLTFGTSSTSADNLQRQKSLQTVISTFAVPTKSAPRIPTETPEKDAPNEDDIFACPTQKLDDVSPRLPTEGNAVDDDDLEPTQILSLSRIDSSKNAQASKQIVSTTSLSVNAKHDSSTFLVPSRSVSRISSKNLEKNVDDIFFCPTQKLREDASKDDDDDLPPTQILSIPEAVGQVSSIESVPSKTTLKKSKNTIENNGKVNDPVVSMDVTRQKESTDDAEEADFLAPTQKLSTSSLRDNKRLRVSSKENVNKKPSELKIQFTSSEKVIDPQILSSKVETPKSPAEEILDDVFLAATQKWSAQETETLKSKEEFKSKPSDPQLKQLRQFFQNVEKQAVSKILSRKSEEKAENKSRPRKSKAADAGAKDDKKDAKKVKTETKKRSGDGEVASPAKKLKVGGSKSDESGKTRARPSIELRDRKKSKSSTALSFDDESEEAKTGASTSRSTNRLVEKQTKKAPVEAEKRRTAKGKDDEEDEDETDKAVLNYIRKNVLKLSSDDSEPASTDSNYCIAPPKSIRRHRRVQSSSDDESDKTDTKCALKPSTRTYTRKSRPAKSDYSRDTVVVSSPAKKTRKHLSSSHSSDEKLAPCETNIKHSATSPAETLRKRIKQEELIIHDSKKTSPKKHKVVFTMLSDPALEASVRCLGGTVVNDIFVSTVLVTNKISRSLKFLTAVSSGKPIVGTKWIMESVKSDRFLDPWDYILKDPETERKFNFRLTDALGRALNQKLLDGYSILLAVNKNADVLKEIVECCGGKCVQRVPSKNAGSKLVVVSYKEDAAKYQKYLHHKPPYMVVAAEAIFSGALTQKVDWAQHLIT